MRKTKNPLQLKQFREMLIIAIRLLKLLWHVDPWMLSFSFLATILPAVFPFITAYIGKLLIDYVVASVSGHTLPLSQLYVLLGITTVVYFLQNAAFRTQDYINTLMWTKVPIYLNQLIFTKTATLDMQYFEDSSFKDLLQKVRESIGYRPQQYVSNVLFLFQSLLQVVIASIALVHLNWLLLILIICIAIPEFINETRQTKAAFGIWDANTKHRKRYWYLSDLLQNMWSVKEVKLFSLGKKFLSEVKDIQIKFYNENAVVAKRTYLLSLFFNVVSAIFLLSIQIFVLFQALARVITIGDINFYQSVISNFQNGLSGLFSNINRMYDNSLYIKSIFELLDAKPLITDSPNAVSLELTEPPVIEFIHVDFSYPGKKEKSLSDINLVIQPGEKIAFVGENGAGKSTIIKLLARFYDVTGGEIKINDINIKDIKLEDLYRMLGILFQDFNRYEDTVKDNIHYGNIQKEPEETPIHKAASDAGAYAFIKGFDKAYHQVLGKTFEEGTELSTGQWQKMALARAFFRDAYILVLDEPTAAIDAKAEAEIFDRVDHLSRGKTVIIISHRFSTVRNVDTIYVIDNGKIVESGDHEALMRKKGQYAKLFTLQAKRYQ